MALMGKKANMVFVDEWVRDISGGEIRDWLSGTQSASLGSFDAVWENALDRFDFSAEPIKTYQPIPLDLFKDARFANCTVQVWEIRGGKHDPLNPNPAAGPARSYKIVSDQSADKIFNNLKRAKMEAHMLHIRLVKAAVAEATKALPSNFGRF